MRRIFYISLSAAFLLTSCKNISQSSIESGKKIQAVEQAEDKFFYIEFVNLDSTNIYRNSIDLVKKELLNNGYIVDKENNNDWQGIRKIDKSEHIILDEISEYHPNIHRFINFSEHDSNNGDIEKIVININKPINDTIPNFNYCSYKKLGHEDWQSVFNPGNFRYRESNAFNESELANWMIKTIVLLTFK
ncbi:hypothetical protein F8C76_05940 [Flagellimonas olearia]|uniref:Lipoprotein n=1 Tax=Flagellimonas olearia TaxID=552546 RepID=A0A6I1E1K6_9FLAO|nr:hypothetical protein [Allomuricauda olearia]KAB7531037.1 hypothetical protein F8C76_05940 [Allomuricauda olearia]